MLAVEECELPAFGEGEVDRRVAADALREEIGDCVTSCSGAEPGEDIIEIGGRTGFSGSKLSSSSPTGFRVRLTLPGLMLGAGKKMERLELKSSSLLFRPWLEAERGVGGGKPLPLDSEGMMPAAGGELIRAASRSLD